MNTGKVLEIDDGRQEIITINGSNAITLANWTNTFNHNTTAKHLSADQISATTPFEEQPSLE